MLATRVLGLHGGRRQLPDGMTKYIGGAVEQRAEIRTPKSAQVLVQITECDQNANLVGTIHECTALDLSLSGIKIESTVEIPFGSRLDIWLNLEPEPFKFFLLGRVNWTNQMSRQGDAYHLGIHLHDGIATDIENWRKI